MAKGSSPLAREALKWVHTYLPRFTDLFDEDTFYVTALLFVAFTFMVALIVSSYKLSDTRIKHKLRSNVLYSHVSTIALWKLLLLVVVLCSVLHYFGVFDHAFELSYDTEFKYSLDKQIVIKQVDLIRHGKAASVDPINNWLQYSQISGVQKCDDSNNLVVLVKSALKNRAHRNAIRETWGRVGNVKVGQKVLLVKTFFLLGVSSDAEVTNAVEQEFNSNHDVIQHDFIDSYYNNTLKTMTAMSWFMAKCQNIPFVLFVDDDYHVSFANLFKFLSFLPEQSKSSLYAGFRFFTHVLRHRPSPFRISLQEYPFSHYPPYITAGAYVMSNSSVMSFYYASLFTERFKFDDVYLGILAYQMGIDPMHNDNFIFWEEVYDRKRFTPIIAAHGFGYEDELKKAFDHDQVVNADLYH